MSELVRYDPYMREAAREFNVPIELVTQQQRNYIKAKYFALNYGAGPEPFKTLLDNMKVD